MNDEQLESSAALKTNSDQVGESVVDFDLQCLDCDYNLRTLPITARCPECGKPVTETFHGNSLHLADSVWLRRVRNGITLAAWTIPSGVVLNVLWTIYTYDRFFLRVLVGWGSALGTSL